MVQKRQILSEEKFLSDLSVVLDFISTYCEDKHEKSDKKRCDLSVTYQGKKLKVINYSLCAACKDTFLYSYARLQECPNDPKPRCRNCKNPCYEKTKWKELAKIMRYSGMKKGLLKVKNIFKRS